MRLADHPLLPRAEVHALVVRAQAGDTNARDRVVIHHQRLVHKTALSFQQAAGGVLELDDLVGDGNIGLMRAVQLWDASKGKSFLSYARLWVLAKLRDHAKSAPIIRGPLQSQARRAFKEENGTTYVQTLGLDAQVTDDGLRLIDMIPSPAYDMDTRLDAMKLSPRKLVESGITDDSFPAPLAPAKRRPGRPRVLNPRTRRSVAATDLEWAAISIAAEKRGVSISKYIRLQCITR